MKTIMIDGLEWQAEDDGIQRTWDEAVEYANGLGNGWRLPTIGELFSIIDYKKYNPACKIENCRPSYFWSSSPYAYDSSRAWYVDFHYGYMSPSNKDYHNYARCVRQHGRSGITKGGNVIENSEYRNCFKTDTEPECKFAGFNPHGVHCCTIDCTVHTRWYGCTPQEIIDKISKKYWRLSFNYESKDEGQS